MVSSLLGGQEHDKLRGSPGRLGVPGKEPLPHGMHSCRLLGMQPQYGGQAPWVLVPGTVLACESVWAGACVFMCACAGLCMCVLHACVCLCMCVPMYVTNQGPYRILVEYKVRT